MVTYTVFYTATDNTSIDISGTIIRKESCIRNHFC